MTEVSPPMSISVLLPDLRPGGAERMHVQLAEQWLKPGYRVEFVLLRKIGELLASLPSGATVTALDADRMRDALRPLVRYLRKVQPDVLLAAMWPLSVLAPFAARAAGYCGRVVVSEHSPLSLAYADRGYAHRLAMRGSMRMAYPLADACIAVSAGVADDLSTLSGLPRSRFEVIQNPAARCAGVEFLPRPVVLEGVAVPLILAVGTLKKVKRHDLLIDAFSRMPAELGATLCILGEGQERETLERQVAARGLSGRVLLPGYAADTAPWYAHADLFVLSSDYEGFGNVIVEAMEYGLPIVSTDCPAGPAEILCGGEYGRLVPVGNAAALAQAMIAALDEPCDREALKARARVFSVDRIAERYLDVLLPASRKGACE